MTKYPTIWNALSAEFADGEVKWRPQGGGNRKVPFITARTAMNRLDAVLGPENWWDRYERLDRGTLCSLSIRLPDGEVITKQDAGGFAGMSDSGDDEKSAYSDAFKRACAKFGLGRYLYGDGVSWHAEPPPPAPAKAVVMPESQPSSSSTLTTATGGAGLMTTLVDALGYDPEVPNAAATAAVATADVTPRQRPQHAAALLCYLDEQVQAHGLDAITVARNYCRAMGYPIQMETLTPEQAQDTFIHVSKYIGNQLSKSVAASLAITGDPAPANGAELLAWVRHHDDEDRSLENRLRVFGKKRNWPEKVADWPHDAVVESHEKIVRALGGK